MRSPRFLVPLPGPLWFGYTSCHIGASRKTAAQNSPVSALAQPYRASVSNLLSEIIGTLVLVFVVGAIFSKPVAGSGLVSGLGAYLVASLVWGIGLSLGGTTGYAINPARDFGPRLAHTLLPIAGKGASDWGYAIIPVIGPLIGGILAGLLLRAIGI
jgi:glycerol uptake facilitator protein